MPVQERWCSWVGILEELEQKEDDTSIYQDRQANKVHYRNQIQFKDAAEI